MARQTSHNWIACDCNDSAGAAAPVSRYFYGRIAYSRGYVACSRCHNPHGFKETDPTLLKLPPTVTNPEDGEPYGPEDLCLDCHREWNVTGNHGLETHPLVDDYAAVAATRAGWLKPLPESGGDGNEGDIRLLDGGVTCTSCHGIHHTDSDSTTCDDLGSSMNNADGRILRADGPENECVDNSLCQACHTYEKHGSDDGSPIGCMVCHGSHEHDSSGLPNYFMLKKQVTLVTPKSGVEETVNLNYTSYPPPDNFNLVCLSCHNMPGAHDVGASCSGCHSHTDGFGHGSGGSGVGCVECHGHDLGTQYDPDMMLPYSAGAQASQGRGTAQSHSTHTEVDSDDQRGPGIYCDSCHDTANFPYFKSGTDGNGDGKYDLAETDVCDTCHSPGGSYDGLDDAAVGAKVNWETGIYAGDGSLQSGKEKWCATCHDESPSVVESISAPNVIGAEEGSYIYGSGWGYYKTGHGLPAGETYASKGGIESVSGRPIECGECHDLSTAHVDGLARTFDDVNSSDTDPSMYRQGYRLKLVDGEEPMQIPWKPGSQPNEPDTYKLCAECHNTRPFTGGAKDETNFISTSSDGTRNRHYTHMIMNSAWWSPDYEVLGGVNTSRPICVTCHNVHGSTQLAMVRDGKLIGQEPGLKVWYYNDDTTLVNEANSDPPDPEDTPLAASDGSVRRAWTSRYLCNHCHSNNNTIKEPWSPVQETSVAPTLEWSGESGFTADGANPDSGPSGSSYAFRVKYADLNNEGPVAPGYINLLIDADNDGVADATYSLEGIEDGDVNYLNGKIYSKTLTLTKTGSSSIGYKFAARDETGLDATGQPTNWSTVTLLNNAPVLAWTDEEDYESDGVNPDRGANGSDFTFRVLYSDADGECPDTDGVDVVVDGTSYELTQNDGASCATGRIYYQPVTLGTTGDLDYHFLARDAAGTAATGEPTSPHTVTVLGTSNNPPSLAWAPDTCRAEGVKPAYGAIGADFEFVVQYTDPDGGCPAAADAVQVTIDGSTSNMVEVDSGDNDCSDGKLYTYTTALSSVGTFYYNFSATDDGGAAAFGEPTAVSTYQVEVVDAYKVRPAGGSGWYTTIQAGVDAAIDPSPVKEVLVYEGDYNERLNLWTGTYSNIEVRSVCGPDATTMRYDGNEVVFLQNVSGVVIDGFDITSVTADGSLTGVRSNSGSVTINDCRIHGHHNTGRGGAIVAGTSTSIFTVTNSELYENRADDDGGAVNLNDGNGHSFTNTVIRDNQATDSGGAVWAQNASATFTDVTIKDNTAGSGGAIYSLNADADFVRCTVTGNVATSGNGGFSVLANGGENFSLENCIVADNQALAGGVSYVNGGEFIAINSTFANNRATGGEGGVLWHQNATAIFRNSILWGNNASDEGHNAYINGGTVTIGDSILASGGDGVLDNAPYFTTSGAAHTLTIGAETTENDPMFVDAAGGDYHIQVVSPAVDNGSATDAPAEDIDGDSRPQGIADDIGADEYLSGLNSGPVLSWTGETGYENDGADPDSGDEASTAFVLRVKYTDDDNDPPLLIQVWIDEDDNGAYGFDEKFDMAEVDAGDTDYTMAGDGKIYRLDRVIDFAGDGTLNSRFYARDVAVEAIGDPTEDQSVNLTNSLPLLSWTGEAEYASDGVYPDSGQGGVAFTFRATYTDGDNVAPDPIQVWVDTDNSGSYDVHEKFDLIWVDDGGQDFSDGETYTRTLQIPYAGNGLDPVNMTYRFYATDGAAEATGDPVADTPLTIDIEPSENSAPSLSWSVAECLDNGVRPPVGDVEAAFEFKVLYTDLDGTGPEGNGIYRSECAVDILLMLDKDNNGTYDSDEKYVLTEADPGDVDCTDGKLYETTLVLEGAVEGELGYSFYATDSFAAATGEPTVDSTVMVYANALKVRPSGGAGWLTTIQAAEDSSFDGSAILVYPNDDFTAAIYTENIEARTTNLTIQAVCGPDLTIVDGGGSGVGFMLRADNQVLDGFGVTNAGDGLYINPSPENITIKNNKIYGNTQYGINVNPGFNIHIDNNEIYRNDSSGIRTNGSTVEITDCDIHHNYAAWGGGVMFNGNVHTITDSVIRDNSGVDGSGIVFNVVGEGTTVTNSVISNNHGIGRGGGIYNAGGSQLTLDKCTITGNQTTSAGGAIYSQSGWSTSALVRMSNSIAAGNSAAGKGGFVYHHSGRGEYYNNTFADNHSSSYGGVFGACTIPEQLEVRNSVFRGNTAVDGTIGSRYMCNGNGPLIHVTDSYFSTDPALSNFSWGSVTSENNIDCCEDQGPADPDKPAGFIEFNVGAPGFSGDGSYHIDSASPLIDRGNAAYAPEDDIDENGRIVGLGGDGSPDMGADEYEAPADSTTAGYVTAYASDPANNTSMTVTMPYLGDADEDNSCTVDYKLSSAHTSVWTNWVTDADCGTSPYTTTMTGLVADEKYDVRAIFADPDGVDGKARRIVSSVDLNWYVDLTAPTRSTAESAGTVTVTATLSRVSDQDVTVPFTVSGTATAEGDDPINYDHDLSDGSIIVPAGSLTGETSFTLNDDALDEASETIVITMGAPVNALADRYDTQTITITDNDSPVLVDFTSASETTLAENGSVTITAQLSEISGLDVEIPFTVNVNSTALGEGVDYSITESPVTIAAGYNTTNITITVNADSSHEGNETVIVDMGTPVNATQGTTTTHTTTITDDDPEPSVTFANASQSVSENAGAVTMTAELSASSGLEVTVPFSISGTATSGGTDHDLVDGNIIIPVGQTSGTTTFTVTDDAIVENDETVIVTMGSPINATVGAESVHTVTIFDNDTVTFAEASQSVSESGAATVTVQLNAASSSDVIVPFSISGSSTATGGGADYSITASPVTIPAGSTSADITVTITDDADAESSETVIVDMGTPTNASQGAITTHILTITDNDSGGSNTAPVLATVNDNCLVDGARPRAGKTGESFEFIVEYTDYDNQCPTSGSSAIQVWIDLDGDGYEAGETFSLNEVSAADTDCNDGKLYSINQTLSTSGSINYRFYASDGIDEASGEPTADNSVEIYSTATVVRPSGSSEAYDYTSVLSAINAVSGNILVYPNDDFTAVTYTENVAIYNKDDRTVVSVCGAESTIISSASTGHTVTVQDSSNFVMDGFSITGATNSGASASGFYINRVDMTTATFRNSKVYGNYYGVYINDADDTPLQLQNLEIYNNSGRGIYAVNADDDFNLIDSTIHSHNTALAGAGIRINDGAAVTITGSVIRDNISSGEGGAIFANKGSLTVTNTIFADNQGSNGGVIRSSNGPTINLVNNTFADNTATNQGGVLYICQPGSHTVRNSIFWGNSAASSGDIAYKACSGFATGFMTVTDSDITTSGSSFGNGTPITSNNIDPAQDPLFVDATNDNYHIQSGSPVIDQANSTYAPADDLDGNLRPVDGDGAGGAADDMGAYEYQP